MRSIVYIAGSTNTGKTTIASKLSRHLGWPFFSVDAVNHAVAGEIGFNDTRQFVFPEYWRDYPNIYELKVKHYRETLTRFDRDLILEGFDLGFEQDRQAILEVVGEHWATFFWLDLPYGRWVDNCKAKSGSAPDWSTWVQLRGYFEVPDHHYRIEDPEMLLVDYQPHQREGFTDQKWQRLGVTPKDKTVLDLGCNDGWIGRYCLEEGAKRVVGVDRNWRYLEETRKKGVETRLLDLDQLNRLHGRFDLVLCLATLQHLKDPARAVKEMARLTRGEFVLEMPVWSGQKRKGWMTKDGYTYAFPSVPLVLDWLKAAFKTVEQVGESVAPDDSQRLIFKAYP